MLLAWLVKHEGDKYQNLEKVVSPHHSALLFQQFGLDAVPDLHLFLQTFAGGEAAHLLWLWDPQQAQDLLQDDDVNDGSKEILLRECPAQHLRIAIETLNKFPHLLPERTQWIRTRLPCARAAAEDLMNLRK